MASGLTKELEQRLGFGISAIPIVSAIGFGFIVISVPAFFAQDARPEFDISYLAQVQHQVEEWAERWLAFTMGEQGSQLGIDAMRAGFLLAGGTLVASVFRSALLRSHRPFSLTALGLLGGLVAIPILSWAVIGAKFALRGGRWVASQFGRIAEWISPAIAWAGIIFAAALTAYGAWLALVWLYRNLGDWRVITGAVITAALGIGQLIGRLQPMLDRLDDWFRRLGELLDDYVAPTLTKAVEVGLWIALALFVFGITLAIVGHVGRTVCLAIVSASRSGRRELDCAEFSAAIGLSLSILLVAAVVNAEFADLFTRIWSNTAYLSEIPTPLPAYRTLMPDSTETLFAPAFVNYSPLADSALICLVSALAILSLVFAARTQITEEHASLIIPVLFAVGIAVACAIPLLILGLLSYTED